MTGLMTGGPRRTKAKKKKQLIDGVPDTWVYVGGGALAAVLLAVAVFALSGGSKEQPVASGGPPAAGAPAAKGAAVLGDGAYDRSEGKDGLIGHWRFATPITKEVKDETGLGLPGHTDGTIDWAQIGDRAGLAFNGDGGFVRVPDHRRLRFTKTESFTLTAWLKAPEELYEGRWQGVINKPHGRVSGWYGIWLANIDGVPTWAFGTSFLNDPVANLIGARSNGNWQLVCIVQDARAGVRHIYVDGRDATRGAPGRAKDCDGVGDLVIGSCIIHEPDGRIVSEPFRGAINEVRVYSLALTPTEILDMSRKND
jgi:hypothetical protein